MLKFGASLLFLCMSLLAGDSAIHVDMAGRDIAVWKPAGATPPAGFPVVIFSHGFTGCNTQSAFLMEALARAGYLVVAPNHADAGCGVRREKAREGGWHPEEPFEKAPKWSDATYKDRRADIEATLDAVLSAKTFQGVPVDPGRVAIAGHSLGGYTALAIAGAWPSWKDARIKAVLALSPFNTPFLANGDLSGLDVPVMYQGGTLDVGISPTVRRPQGAYDRSSKPKFYVEFRGAGHLAWTDLNPHFQDVIDRYGIAFFDRYLKGETKSDPITPLVAKPWPASVDLVRSDF
jgi:predicted dienelactone hydrolase